ncbi:hypothetical protein GCM10010331_15650 [Streptomyces xanthochromogenes]|uniref:hypothetical protein n=1 Tax=Streptomyces xanthochromogenes TaxID=67384 RepID=UPI001679B2FE|nr:hypothetical protein [Streptomyces xanthochromogenes]GHB30135.1 hypothetical protein GCM10010331_15650 [Streptomyces xanthochromogenes]
MRGIKVAMVAVAMAAFAAGVSGVFDPPRSAPSTANDLNPRERATRYKEQLKISADMNWEVKQEFMSVGLDVTDDMSTYTAEATCTLGLRIIYGEAEKPRLAKAYADLEADGWRHNTDAAAGALRYHKDNSAAAKSKYANDTWQLAVGREHDVNEPGSDIELDRPGKYVDITVDNCTSPT